MGNDKKKELKDVLLGMRLSKKESEMTKGGAAMSAAAMSNSFSDVSMSAANSLDFARLELSSGTDTSVCIWSSNCSSSGCFTGCVVKCMAASCLVNPS